MENSLLQREKELFQLNTEINVKTRDVCDKSVENKPVTAKKVNSVLSARSTPENVVRRRRSMSSSPSLSEHNLGKVENKVLIKQASKKLGKNNLKALNPAAVVPKIIQHRHISQDGMVKFLKSKAAILQTELDTVQEEHEHKLRELNETLKKLTHMSNLREQATCKNVALEKVVVRFEQRNVELEKKVLHHDETVKGMTKELNAIKCQLKASHSAKQMLEKRCTKLQDECEELRNRLKCSIDLEKEMRDTTRQERSTLEEQIKELRKQRLDMLQAYKKQLILIDKLKRTKLNRFDSDDDDAVSAMQANVEKEFIKFLDNGL